MAGFSAIRWARSSHVAIARGGLNGNRDGYWLNAQYTVTKYYPTRLLGERDYYKAIIWLFDPITNGHIDIVTRGKYVR